MCQENEMEYYLIMRRKRCNEENVKVNRYEVDGLFQLSTSSSVGSDSFAGQDDAGQMISEIR